MPEVQYNQLMDMIETDQNILTAIADGIIDPKEELMLTLRDYKSIAEREKIVVDLIKMKGWGEKKKCMTILAWVIEASNI